MPITAENRSRYPADWPLRSRFIRFFRAKNHCEFCGVRNYSVGRWVGDQFITDRQQFLIDFPDYADWKIDINKLYPSTYKTACAIRDDINKYINPGIEQPYIVIVLTCAHIHDRTPENCSLLNLAALCQRCHNRHDIDQRRASRQTNRTPDQMVLF